MEGGGCERAGRREGVEEKGRGSCWIRKEEGDDGVMGRGRLMEIGELGRGKYWVIGKEENIWVCGEGMGMGERMMIVGGKDERDEQERPLGVEKGRMMGFIGRLVGGGNVDWGDTGIMGRGGRWRLE